MAVRNIKSVGNIKPIPIHVWIPPKFSVVHKIEIESNGNTYDITEIILNGEYTDGITETIGSFEIKFDNSSQEYTNLINVYDKINIYLDYGNTATTKVFVGLIEKISKRNNTILLTGRSSAIRTIGKNVIYQATDKKRSDVIKEIVDNYFSGVITTNNVEEDDSLVTVNYFERPFWKIMEELCNSAGYDAYIDSDFDLHYFESNSKLNTTEAIVHEYNLIETGDFAPSIESLYNRIRVYGKKTDGVPLIVTEEDKSSQESLGGDIKELKIDDTSITTREQAIARAQYELEQSKNPITIGRVESLGLPTIKPGEKLRISDPMNCLEPGEYVVHKFKHMFSNDDPFKTEVTIQKEGSSIPKIIKDRISFEKEVTENDNPNDMEQSIVIDFSSDVGSHSNTEIDTESEVLQTQSGQSSGTWISDTYTVSEGITGIEVRIKGNKLSSSNAFVSIDGGASYTNINFSGTKQTLSGQDIKVKIELNSEDSEVNVVGIFYKT
ncbi:MAG: hypothetical protein ACOC1K_02005 [Nanoarchaeota archaeon]